MTQYVICSTNRETLKEIIKAVRRTFPKTSWENITYVTHVYPLWIMTTKEAAIKECRRYNRKTIRSATYFFIELETYEE